MKFAHLPDCHLGCWNNHPELNELSLKAFEKTIDMCIEEGVDFILLPGDLFDNSLPPIDIIKRTVATLKKARDKGIRIYGVAGSHDFSPTGKTMISVLESAGLIVDVAKFDDEYKLKTFEDESGAVISGVFGRKGSLEHSLFEKIKADAKGEFRIFLFHSAVEEFRPQHMKEMAAIPLSLLPDSFDYYATGHVHERFEGKKDNKPVIFPGVLFPTNFKELENYNDSGFYLVTKDGEKLDIKWKGIKLCDVLALKFNADGKTPVEVYNEIIKKLDDNNLEKKIILIRISGVLENGKVSDINFRDIFSFAETKGALVVKKNISSLTTKELELPAEQRKGSIEEIEDEMINKFTDNPVLVKNIMRVFSQNKNEAETVKSFEERIKNEVKELLGI